LSSHKLIVVFSHCEIKNRRGGEKIYDGPRVLLNVLWTKSFIEFDIVKGTGNFAFPASSIQKQIRQIEKEAQRIS
jgi:hypothetical protein